MTQLTRYIDGFDGASLHDGVVRLKLVVVDVQPDSAQSQEISVSAVGNLATSLRGLVQMHTVLDGFIKELRDNGVLQPREDVSDEAPKVKKIKQ